MEIPRKKILFTIHGLSTGGAEKFLVALVNNLDNKIFECRILSYSDDNPLAQELIQGVALKIISRSHKFDIAPIIETRRYVFAYKPDLLFCVGFFSFFIIHISSLFTFRKFPRIISYHTTIHRNRKDDELMKFYLRFLRKNDKIVAVSKNQIEYTSNNYRIKKSFFYHVYNGIDTNYWRLSCNEDERLAIKKMYGIPNDAKIIIKVAGFRGEKNHKTAINAFEQLTKAVGLDVYLLLVGDGELKEEIQKYVSELNLSHKIIFAGNQVDVRPFYWASNVFTLTSSGVETFSIAALEALSCGLPCVLTNIGGANEMIKQGVNGYLSTLSAEDISEKWLEALRTRFDHDYISLNVKNNFSLDFMIREYHRLLIDS